MKIRSESRTIKRWSNQVVHISNPDLTSPAALALLTQKLLLLDKSIYSNSKMSRIRNRWMNIQLKKRSGKLSCSICGKGGLSPYTRDKNKLATLDHVIELRNGGDWKNPENFRVACYRCNCRREHFPLDINPGISKVVV